MSIKNPPELLCRAGHPYFGWDIYQLNPRITNPIRAMMFDRIIIGLDLYLPVERTVPIIPVIPSSQPSSHHIIFTSLKSVEGIIVYPPLIAINTRILFNTT